MERTKSIPKESKETLEKADAILCGDLHLQEGQIPVCRLDNFEGKQWQKLDFISDLQEQHNCPVLCSGDLYNFWKPSPELLSKTSQHLPSKFYTIYGNHDLKGHNLGFASKSGIYNLMINDKLHILKNTHWQQSPESDLVINNRKILVWHVMTYQGKDPWPNHKSTKGSKLLRKYPQYDLILTGHNHKPFVEKHEGRLLVNPGSIFRLTADQQDHKPRVYLWYADTNTVKAVYLPIEKSVISREHIDIKEERNNRIDAFITGLDSDWEALMSFKENLEAFKHKNKVKKSIMDIIYEVTE